MAQVEAHIGVPPARVFEVLANGWLYSGWVVGASHMRAVEPDWPAAGSRLFHASGVWPAVVRDETKVEQVEPDRRLVMTARGGAMGAATIEISLSPDGHGTLVVLRESPTSGPGKWVNNPLSEALLHRRNVETLARLALLAERPSAPRD